MNKKLLSLLLISLLVALVLAGCGTNQQGEVEGEVQGEAEDAWPEETIELILHQSAGGGSDTLTRSLATCLSDVLDVNVIVKNVTGGGGSVAFDYMQKLPSEGYAFYHTSPTGISTMVSGTTPYSLEDWVPAINLELDPRWLVKRANDDRFNDINEIIEYAKENPDKLSVSGAGATGIDYMVLAPFMDQAGAKFSYVPFDATGEALAALLGEHTDFALGSIGAFSDYLETGELELVLLFWDERLDDFADVPATVPDLGLKGPFISTNRGFIAKKGTPPEVIDKFNKAVLEAIKDPRYQDYQKANPTVMDGILLPDEFGVLLQNQWDVIESILKDLGQIK